tara:strand:- start:1906 stop:2118 length:213 start_codon:yes stop_codon:yes gene_type:complete
LLFSVLSQQGSVIVNHEHLGWMSPDSKTKLDQVHWLVWLILGWTFWLTSGHASKEKPPPQPLYYSDCGDR